MKLTPGLENFHRTFSSGGRTPDQQKLSNFVVYMEALFEVGSNTRRWGFNPIILLGLFEQIFVFIFLNGSEFLPNEFRVVFLQCAAPKIPR